MASEILGLDEFRRTLRKIDRGFDAEFKIVHQKVADRAAEWARFEAATSGVRIQALSIDAIRGTGTATSAKVGVSASGRNPFALAAFWGAERHSGWYGASKYRDSITPQFPEWVGNSWDVAVAGQGPYAINDALAKHREDIFDIYLDAVFDISTPAFPST